MRNSVRIIPIVILLVATSLFGKSTYPEPTGHVNDFAGVLAPETRTSLEKLLVTLTSKTGAELAIVTLPSLNEEPIENVAVDLFKQWGIGQKGKDNGLLFLIAPNDRKMRIEVGYGLEPILPDGLTGRIRDTYIIPEFKKGDFNTGILHGTQAMVQLVARDAGVTIDASDLPALPHPNSRQPEKSSLLTKLFQLGLIIFLVILFIRHPSLFFAVMLSGLLGGGRGGRSSGGFGGGFGGFGGGGSGGGGSSGSW